MNVMSVPAVADGDSSPSNQPNVLIVDDHRMLAEALADRLAIDGFVADVATTAAQAIKLAMDSSYRLAFVDLQLPDMSGGALNAELRRRNPSIRTVLMTGCASQTADVGSGYAGFDAVLPKPWRPGELASLVDAFRRNSQ